MEREEIIEELEQYYDAAGFTGMRENRLERQTTAELVEIYNRTINRTQQTNE